MAHKKKTNVPTVEETNRTLSEPIRTGPADTGERYQMPRAQRVEEAEVESKQEEATVVDNDDGTAAPQEVPAQKPTQPSKSKK